MVFTDEQKALINNDSTQKKVHITFPNHEIGTIENDRIYQEEMSLEESLIDQDNIVFGKCNSAIFKVKVADFVENIDGARMDVSITLSNEELGTTMELPFGKYYVNNVERTADRRFKIITAQDFMTLFDVDISEWYKTVLFPTAETNRTVNVILSMLCSHIGVKYDNDFELIHGNLIIGKNIEPTQLSARDYLQQLCEINACFGHFDYDGILRFIMMEKSALYPSETLYPSNKLYPRGSGETERISLYKSIEYEDYEVKSINSAQIRLEDDDIGVTATEENADRINRYIITGNSFLLGLSTEDMKSVAQRLLHHMKNLIYTPNTTTMKGGLYLDLGSSYVVHTTNDSFESYVLKRSIRGIQGISSTLEASGSEWLSETPQNIASEITILKGKSAKLRHDIDGLESTFTDYEKNTESKFSQTTEAIETEVKRATGAEGELSSKITQTAEGITSTVARNTKSYDTTGVKIDLYGYGTPSSDIGLNGNKYLDQSTGYVYTKINGAWVKENEPLQSVQESVESMIEQTASSITQTVSETYETKTNAGEQYKELSSQISQTAHTIELSVDDSSGKNTGIKITLKDENGNVLDTADGTIVLSGDVIVKSNLTDGTTQISGDNITTGTINCDLLEGGTINGQNINGCTISSSDITADSFTARGIINMSSYDDVIATVLSYDYSQTEGYGITLGNYSNVQTIFFDIIGKTAAAVGINAFSIFVPVIISGNNLNVYGNAEIASRLTAGEIQCLDEATSSESANCRFTTGATKGLIRRSTGSSKRFKHDITKELSEELNPNRLYDIGIYQYKFNDDYLGKEDIRYEKDVIGFIAEDVYEKYPIAADFNIDEDGNLCVNDWNMRYMIPAMLKLIQDQKSEIDTLKEQVSFLMQKIGGAEHE